MVTHSDILRAFLLGAPMEAIALLTGQDAEAAIRAELLRLAQTSDGQPDASAEPIVPLKGEHGPAIILPQSKPRRRINESATSAALPAPAKKPVGKTQADKAPAGDETFTDLLLTTIQSLGEPTLAEIYEDLLASGIRKTKYQVSGTLSFLRKSGRVERVGDGHTGKWRVAG